MGTINSANDEWIELYNRTGAEISVEGWRLKASDGSPQINLTGAIPSQGFWLLERTDDSSVINIAADQIYTGALNNNGENLELYDDAGKLIDSVAGAWPAGDNTTKQTMSRFDLKQWKTSKTPSGTPKAPNTFIADIADASGAPTEIQESLAHDKLLEAEPRTVEPQTGRELAAAGQQATPKTPFALLIASVLAVSFGAIILILKKGLK